MHQTFFSLPRLSLKTFLHLNSRGCFFKVFRLDTADRLVPDTAMQTNLLYLASYELAVTVLVALVVVFVSLRIFERVVLRIFTTDADHRGNAALSIFSGSLVLCALLIVQTAILPTVDTLRILMENYTEPGAHLLRSLGYLLAYFSASIVIGLGLLILVFLVYTRVTHTDELEEIKQNNIAVAILLGFVMVSVTLFIRPTLERFIGSLVSYEKVHVIEEPPPADTTQDTVPSNQN